MPTAPYELPYEGAKEMLLVDEVDNKEFLTGLFHAMYDELPAPKPKKKKQTTPQFLKLRKLEFTEVKDMDYIRDRKSNISFSLHDSRILQIRDTFGKQRTIRFLES